MSCIVTFQRARYVFDLPLARAHNSHIARAWSKILRVLHDLVQCLSWTMIPIPRAYCGFINSTKYQVSIAQYLLYLHESCC